MKTILQPAWLICFALFSVHQVLEKGLDIHFTWADNYLDTLLCMPIFLGLLLAERRFFLGNNKMYTFSFFETMVIVLVLAIIFEEGFPRWSNKFTKDYWDYLNYFVGALFFYFFINRKV